VRDLDDRADLETRSRSIVEAMALALQAALLLRADATVGDAFCRARLGDRSGRAYGTLPASMPFAALIERAFPG
jgi:putative acyl-CoA dehydrogenase